MTGELLLVALILWMILILVTAVLEENHSKRVPSDKLRFPRVFGVMGMGIPFPCGWMICESSTLKKECSVCSNTH